jgi:hypothetical protein
MGFFGMLFWIVAIVLIVRACRRRREYRRDRRRVHGEVEDHGSVLDALETRLQDLEDRLDFTERLLQSRSSSAPRG